MHTGGQDEMPTGTQEDRTEMPTGTQEDRTEMPTGTQEDRTEMPTGLRFGAQYNRRSSIPREPSLGT